MTASKDSLESISAQIRDIQHSFSELTTGYLNKAVYKVVAIGLYLLKGEMNFLLTAQVCKVHTKSRKRNDKGQLQAQEGFTSWLEKAHPDITQNTSQRFRNAARRVGLTSDSTLADVEQLRETQALHGKTLTELYKALPAPGGDDGDQGDGGSSIPSLVHQTQLDLFSTLDQVLVLREQMEPQEYEATHLRLHATLERLTGAKWVMTDEPPSIDASEHGDVKEMVPHGGSKSENGRFQGSEVAKRWAKKGKGRK